jgi:hypothetical protein
MQATPQAASLRTCLSLPKKDALPSHPGLCRHAVITHRIRRDKLTSFAFVVPSTFSVTGASTRVYFQISNMSERITSKREASSR